VEKNLAEFLSQAPAGKAWSRFSEEERSPDSSSRYLKRVSYNPSEKVTHQKEYPKAGAEFCVFPNKKVFRDMGNLRRLEERTLDGAFY
jgi:hypothetical protein